MKKKSILFILPDLHAGGAERVVTTIANHLPREKFIPIILLLRKEGPYLEILEKDIEIIDLQIQRIRHALFPIFSELRKRKPDIVFSGFGEVNAYLSLFIKLLPKIKFIARETNVVSQHVTRKEIRFFYQFYNNYDQIICQSEDMKDDLLLNFSIAPNKISKINNPVDFQFIKKNLTSSTKPPCFFEGFKNVVAIGNLSYRKGFDRLLKVFSFLKKEKILLHILGEGRDHEMLQQMQKDLELKNVIFHGVQKNPYSFLQFADLFVLSSHYEGFPNVLLEAGACGCYALVNNCQGGINEIIQQYINGEVSEIINHEDFAKKIKEILLKNHDKEAIIQSIQSRFSKEMILKKYFDLFENI